MDGMQRRLLLAPPADPLVGAGERILGMCSSTSPHGNLPNLSDGTRGPAINRPLPCSSAAC